MLAEDVTPTDARLEAAKGMFAYLWASYLAQWGPPVRSRGRRHHHWRLHQLLGFMAELEDVSGAGDKVWDPYRGSLLGWASYWKDGTSYRQHHRE